MINKNTNWKKQKQNKPFLLKPIGKDYLWGGCRLNRDFAKNISMEPLAETWECSTHPDGISVVASGKHKGENLREVLASHPEYYGKYPLANGELPILVKLIDAKQNLSVQVHPDDAYACQYENGSRGKTEMWYVLDAEPGSQLIYGFSHDMNPDSLRRNLKTDTIEKYLQKITVEKDDVFFIEAGTVHALGAGALVAEIQENSNITYRLYDYNRRDKNGALRQLHIDKAMAVMNYKSSAVPRQPLRVLRYRLGFASELLCRCRYFQVERLLVNTIPHQKKVIYPAVEDSFQVLLCIDGKGMLYYASDEFVPFQKGDCIFVPAGSIDLEIEGKAQILKIVC